MARAWHNEPHLVSRSAQGDVAAFGRLVTRYRGAVFGLAYHVLRSFDDAEDVAQEALVTAYRKLGGLRDPRCFGTWLREIALNTARSWLRRQVRERRRTKESCPGPAPEERGGVLEALDGLPAVQHAVMCLRYIGGYTNAEVAGFMGVSVETVRSRLRLAKQKLRKELMDVTRETLESKRPDERFIESVVAAIAELGEELTRTAPDDLREFLALSDEELSNRPKALISRGAAQMRVPPKKGTKEYRAGELPDTVRELLRRALYESWLGSIVHLLRHPPEYLARFDEAVVEFGRYSGGPCANEPYAAFYRPDPGARGVESIQFNLITVEEPDSVTSWDPERGQWRIRRV
jgi:RNA polymerase sigma-70 factor (ECF subfamily)